MKRFAIVGVVCASSFAAIPSMTGPVAEMRVVTERLAPTATPAEVVRPAIEPPAMATPVMTEMPLIVVPPSAEPSAVATRAPTESPEVAARPTTETPTVVVPLPLPAVAIRGTRETSLAMTAGAAYAQELEVQRLDITDFGIYALDREIIGRDPRGINLGTATNVAHTATQRTVPAQIGVTFGFRYRVVGKPEGASIPLKKVIIYPAPGLQTPASSSSVRKAEFELEARIGETNTELYTLEDQFELVPGTWVLEMWLGNRKLASQPFRLDKHADKTDGEKPDRRRAQAGKPNPGKPESGCVRDCEGL